MKKAGRTSNSSTNPNNNSSHTGPAKEYKESKDPKDGKEIKNIKTIKDEIPELDPKSLEAHPTHNLEALNGGKVSTEAGRGGDAFQGKSEGAVGSSGVRRTDSQIGCLSSGVEAVDGVAGGGEGADARTSSSSSSSSGAGSGTGTAAGNDSNTEKRSRPVRVVPKKNIPENIPGGTLSSSSPVDPADLDPVSTDPTDSTDTAADTDKAKEDNEDDDDVVLLSVTIPHELTPNPDPPSYLSCVAYSLSSEEAFYACCQDQVPPPLYTSPIFISYLHPLSSSYLCHS